MKKIKKGKRHRQSDLDKIKNRYYQKYKSWGKVTCPALNSYVEFTNLGLSHLSEEKFRTKVEKIERIKLLPLAKKVIEITTTIQGRRFQNYHDHYEFSALLDGVKIKVIVREYKKSFYFYSVYKM